MQKAGEVLKDMEIAKLPNPPQASAAARRGLVTKLCEVMGAVKRIKKSGHNSFHNYDYATEADVVEAIRDELAERHIFIFPDVLESKRMPHEIETMKGVRKTQLTEVMICWTFVDGDTGEMRNVHVPGVGEDPSDKGFYKSFTGSEKYMLMKTFLIPTGDDPERESKTDAYDAKEKQKAVAARKVGDYDRNRKQVTPVQDDTLLVTEWGEGFVSLSGGGLTILRSEMPSEEAKRLGLKKHPENPALAVMPAGEVFKLQDFCQRIKVVMHWTKGATAAVGDEGTIP